MVLGTRPVDFGALRYSAGFMWNQEEGISETDPCEELPVERGRRVGNHLV